MNLYRTPKSQFTNKIEELQKKNEELQIRCEKLEGKIRESQYQGLESILNTAINGYWRVDMQGRILEVNDVYCRMSGYTREELLQMVIPDLEALANDRDTKQHIEQLKSSGWGYFETKHKRKDKSIFDVSCKVQYIEELNQFVGFISDLTLYEKLEPEINLKDQKYAALVELSTSGIAFLDTNNIHRVVNKKFAEISGEKVDNIIGKSITDVMPKPMLIEVLKIIEEVKKTGSGIELRRYIKPDNRHYVENFTPLYDSGNKYLGILVVVTDITEVVRTERKIQVAEKSLIKTKGKYKRLIENLPATVYQCKKDWSVDIISNSEPICGYSNSELIENRINWLDLVVPEDMDKVFVESQEFTKKPMSISREYRIRTKDNEIKYVLDNLTSAFDDENNFEGVDGVIFDLTENKKSELAIKQQNNKLNAVINTIPDLIFVVDDNWTYQEFYVNDDVDLLIRPEHIIGANVRDTFPECEVQYHLEHLEKCLKNKEVTTYEYSVESEGQRIYFEARLSAIDDHKILILARDITEKKEIAEQMIDTNQKLQGILDNMDDAFLQVDSNGIISFVNQSAVELYGYPINELVGMHMLNLYHDKNDREHLFSELQKRGKINDYVARGVRKNGEVFWASVNSKIIYDDKGKLILTQSIIRDITRRIEMQIQLKEAKEKAEESNRLKTAFLANMSHEIRTPLNAIVGFSTILAEDSNTPEKKEIIEIINGQTKLMLKLIDDVVDAAKIESGTLKIEKKRFDLNSTLNKLTTIYENESRLKDIEFICQKSKGSLNIISDEERIKQVYINLLNNALKFTSSGRITFGYEINSDSQLVCFVRDTGCGISQENQDKIFERFFKLDEFTQGAGLGLSIVKNVIEKLDARIWVESEIGKGSCFYFQIGINSDSTDFDTTEISEDNSIKNRC